MKMENIPGIGPKFYDFAMGVLKLSPEAQDNFFKKLVSDGTTTEDQAVAMQQGVAYIRLLTDTEYNNRMQEALKKMLYSGMLS